MPPVSTPLAPHPLVAGGRDFRAVLSHRGFRDLWFAALVSRTGDTVNFVALALFVLATTNSAAAVSGVVLAEGVGLIVGALLAQFLVDQLAPRPLMVSLDAARAVAAALLALAPSYPMALVVALALAVGTAVFSPTSSALVPRLLPRELLPAANGLLWTAGVALQLVAAPVAGLLVANGAARIVFAVNAASFVGSGLLLLRLPGLSRATAVVVGPWHQLPEAFRLMRSVAVLPPLLVMQLLAALSVGATSALLVVLAEKAYQLTATGYGLWLAAIALGALVGPLVLLLLIRVAPERVVPAAYAVRGVGDVGLGLLSQGIAGGALLGAYGVNTSTGMVTFQTLLQRRIPEAIRGRTFALLDLTWQAGRLVSIAAGGLLAGLVGIRAVFVIGGLLLLASATVGGASLHPEEGSTAAAATGGGAGLGQGTGRRR